MRRKVTGTVTSMLVETLVVLSIGAVVTLMLLKTCLCMLKPLTNQLEEIRRQQTEQTEIINEVLDYEKQ